MLYTLITLLAVIAFEMAVMRPRSSSLFMIYLWVSVVPAAGYLLMTLTPMAAYLNQVTYTHTSGYDRFFAAHIVCLWAGYTLFRFVSSLVADPRARLSAMPRDDTNTMYMIGLAGCCLFLAVYCAINLRDLSHPANAGVGDQLIGSKVGNVSPLDRVGSYVTLMAPWLIGLVRYSPRTVWLRNVALGLVVTSTLDQSIVLASRGGMVSVGAMLYFSLRLHHNFRGWHLFVGLALLVGVVMVRGASDVGFIGVFLVKMVGNVVSDSYIYDLKYWTHHYYSFHFFAIGRFIGKSILAMPGADFSPAEFFIPVVGRYPWNTASALGGFLFNFSPPLVLIGSFAAGAALRVFDANSDSRYNLAWVLRPIMAMTVFLAPSFLLLSSPQIFTDVIVVLLLHLSGRLQLLRALVRPQANGAVIIAI